MESNGGGEPKVFSSNSQITRKAKTVGQSKFYDVASSAVTPEKQDIMKPEDLSEDVCGKSMIQSTFLLMMK